MSDESKPVPEEKKQVKIDNSRSRFARQKSIQEEFEKKADQTFQTMQDRQKEALELGQQFLQMMRDKTLPAQKLPIAQSLERELLNKMVTFAVMVNNDQTEPEGMGSVSLMTLLFKAALIMRDNYNQIEYRLEQLESNQNSSKTE